MEPFSTIEIADLATLIATALDTAPPAGHRLILGDLERLDLDAITKRRIWTALPAKAQTELQALRNAARTPPDCPESPP